MFEIVSPVFVGVHVGRQSRKLSSSKMLQHHDMPLRALLRNMRLLTGLRSQGRQSLLLAGADASQFATNLRKLEPALDVSVVDSESVPMSGK